MILTTHNAFPALHFHLSGAPHMCSSNPAGNLDVHLFPSRIPFAFKCTFPCLRVCPSPKGGVGTSCKPSSLSFSRQTLFLNVRYLQGCKNGRRVYVRGGGGWGGVDEVMYTSNTSIAWTSLEKTNDSVVKSTGQVGLATAVISLNKGTVQWMNGWPCNS